MVTRPIQTRGGSGPPRGCLTLFFLIFFAAGAAGTYFLLWRPVSRLLASRSWTEMACTVLSSQVATVSGSDGDTYKVDIHYTWRDGGRIYESDRYDFMIGSSSGTKGKQAVVDRYPTGARVPCWIDPADPSSAVLSRAPLADLPNRAGSVAVPGRRPRGAGLDGAVRAERRRPTAGGAESPFGVPFAALAAAAGPAELKPAMTPVGDAARAAASSPCSGTASSRSSSGRRSRCGSWGIPYGCLTLFLIPFVLDRPRAPDLRRGAGSSWCCSTRVCI